jgi:hypothetical protein
VGEHREEDEAVRHMLMMDVAEDVSKDVPISLGIRLIPVEVAVQSLNMRLLIPRAIIRVCGYLKRKFYRSTDMH